MANASLVRQTALATLAWVVFVLLFTTLVDMLRGEPINLASKLVAALIGAAIYATGYYLLRRRSK
jgi:hypothetical protein